MSSSKEYSLSSSKSRNSARVMLNANAILWRVFRFSVSGDMRKEPPPLATVFCSHWFQPNYSRGLCDEKEIKKEYVPTSQLLPAGDGLLKALFDAPHTGWSRIAEHPHATFKKPAAGLIEDGTWSPLAARCVPIGQRPAILERLPSGGSPWGKTRAEKAAFFGAVNKL